jgi:hypothetical protein
MGPSDTNAELSHRYQEEALDFIMQRENGSSSEEYYLWKPKYLNDDSL